MAVAGTCHHHFFRRSKSVALSPAISSNTCAAVTRTMLAIFGSFLCGTPMMKTVPVAAAFGTLFEGPTIKQVACMGTVQFLARCRRSSDGRVGDGGGSGRRQHRQSDQESKQKPRKQPSHPRALLFPEHSTKATAEAPVQALPSAPTVFTEITAVAGAPPIQLSALPGVMGIKPWRKLETTFRSFQPEHGLG
jgi:hypothetical protein